MHQVVPVDVIDIVDGIREIGGCRRRVSRQ